MAKSNRMNIEIKMDTYERLFRFKGKRTWNGLLSLWCDRMEGITGTYDDLKFITVGEYEELMGRIMTLEEKVR